MKKTVFCVLIAACLCCSLAAENALRLFVASNGSDSNPGTREQPLKTLSGAKEAVRRNRADSRYAFCPVFVEFAEGVYSFSKPVVFEFSDSGKTAETAVHYQAETGKRVVFSGGVPLTKWRPVTDPGILEILPEAGREKVRWTDLPIPAGKLRPYGFACGIQVAEPELFYDTLPLHLTRYPKTGFRKLISGGKTGPLVLDASGRSARWRKEPDPWLLAYWCRDWAEQFEPVSLTGRPDEIERKLPFPLGEFNLEKARWFACNLLCELSEPGEYYIDRRANPARVYMIPPYEGGHAVVSFSESLIRSEHLEHVIFSGFIMEHVRGDLIQIGSGTGIRIRNCVLRNCGNRAAVLNGRENRVEHCDITQTGEGGVVLTGGDRTTLTPGNNVIFNNDFREYSRRGRTYRAAVSIDGCGGKILHNRIHDAPHMGLSVRGNDNLVSGNEIYQVIRESGDAGAYYSGRDWTQRGTVVEFNYFHHIKAPGELGGMGIYLDDQFSGTTIRNNVFELCHQPVYLGGGCDNRVIGNFFLNCWKNCHLDNRGNNWQKAETDRFYGELRTYLRQVPYRNPLWKKRYPELYDILNDDPGTPKRNLFEHNFSAGGKWYDIQNWNNDGTTPLAVERNQILRNNLVNDSCPDGILILKNSSGQVLGILLAPWFAPGGSMKWHLFPEPIGLRDAPGNPERVLRPSSARPVIFPRNPFGIPQK